MCLAYPGTVKKITGQTATINFGSSSVIASLVPEPKQSIKINDKVLVQTGIIVKILSPKEYTEIISAWSTLDQLSKE